MRRTRSLCCARAASGHPTAAPPSSVKKSAGSQEVEHARLSILPRSKIQITSGVLALVKIIEEFRGTTLSW
jgi:hypothetical protein